MLALLVTLVLTRPLTQPCPASPADPRERITLGVGTQKVLQVSGLVSYTVGDPELVILKPLSASQVLLIGASAGWTPLVLKEAQGKRELVVDVRNQLACELVICELCKLFPCGATLDARMVGDRIFLDGEASSLEEYTAARRALAQYPNVILLGRLKQSVIDAAFVEANLELSRQGFHNVRFVPAGEEVFLEGSADEERRRHLLAVAAPLRERLAQHLWRPPRPPAPPAER